MIVFIPPSHPDLSLNLLAGILGQMLLDHQETGAITCILTDNQQIQQLNRDYRQKDTPTDVLSFDLRDPVHPEEKPIGEIYISLEKARMQAADANRPFQLEVAHLTIHGTLHLLGYEHDTDAGYARMRGQENHYLERLEHVRSS